MRRVRLGPSSAYRDAVRAVEEIACPLVLATSATNNSASLGTVRDHLRDAGHEWRFVLVDNHDDGTVEPLVAMAVHLAATLVQLLSAGALTRRGGS